MATRKSTTRTKKPAGKLPTPGLSARARMIWVALVVSMTSVGGVLYALDPSAKSHDAKALMAKTPAALAESKAPGTWTKIVLVDTGSPFADAQTLHDHGVQLGEPAGVGYHFVIGNGRGLDDGRPYSCKFWNEQTPASAVYAPGAIDGTTIVIGVAGNTKRDRVTVAQFEQARSLVADLMRKHRISFDRVDFSRLGPGFGAAAFREAFGG